MEPSAPVEPFGDHAGELPIANRLLKDWQREVFHALGLEVVDSPARPCLVLPENTFISADALKQFIRGAEGENAVLVLGESRFGRSSSPVQRQVTSTELGWRFERIRLLFSKADTFQDIVIDPDELKIDLPMNNPYLDQTELKLGLPRAPVMQIDHWVHLLWVNQIAGGMTALRTPKWKWGLKVLWAIIRRFSFNKWKILSNLNQIGKGADIHPTAIIEGSTLGKNVTVGPYARVLMSHLDDGAVVMAGAQVEFSTLGSSAMVSEQSVLRFSLLYPNAVASQYLLQQSVLGRGAVTTGGAFTMDLNFDREIRVPLDGKLHGTGQHFLGCAFGHGSRIGTGFWLASGRTIPNGYFLIRDPEQTLSIVDTDLPTQQALVVKGRHLQPMHLPQVSVSSGIMPADDPTDPAVSE